MDVEYRENAPLAGKKRWEVGRAAARLRLLDYFLTVHQPCLTTGQCGRVAA